MKINMPVTDVEYPIDENDSIVSKTDLKGVITYANEDFIRVSGFSREEMIGKGHNLVRHPDVPAEYFEDMWKSLKAERPWTGVVKNRRKNGDYYWLLNNVAPFYENDQLVGYMSVRLKASPEQIEAASHAYRLFREGKAGKLKISNGKVVKPSLFGKFYPFTNFTVKARLIFIIGLLSLLMTVIGGMGLRGMSKTNEGLHAVYKDRTVTMGLLFNISELQRENLMLIASALVNPIPEVIRQNAVELDRNVLEITKLWNAYLASYPTPEEKILADNFTEYSTRFVRKGLTPAIAALRANDTALADKIRQEDIRPLYKLANQSIRELMQWQIEAALEVYQEAQSRYRYTRDIAFGLTLMGIALALWLGFTLIRAIVQPLETAIGHFRKIAQGHYNNNIDTASHDEIGRVMAALKAMQIKCGFDVSETKRIAAEHRRIMVALDSVSTGCMIADSARQIIYANKAVTSIFSSAEMDIRKQLPNFSATNLVGANIDNFHQNPSYQAQILSSINAPRSTKLEFGSKTLMLTVSPAFSEAGERLGTVAELREWKERTITVAIENDIRRLLNALSHRDLSVTITGDYSGSFAQIRDDANITVKILKEFINEIREVASFISAGAKESALGKADQNDLLYRAKETGRIADVVSGITGEGDGMVNQIAIRMDEIKDISRKIAGFISAIDDVVLQTNILAHTAAIEATRAGEHGRGFEAVAIEMRNFAQRAANSSGEIRKLLDDSEHKASDGSKLATQTSQIMEEVINSIGNVKAMVSAIIDASTEQAAGFKQLNQAVNKWKL